MINQLNYNFIILTELAKFMKYLPSTGGAGQSN